MKILMGVPFLFPAVVQSGAARSVYYLASAMVDLGHQVTVVTTDLSDNGFHRNGLRPRFELIRIPNLSHTIASRFHFYTPMGALKHAERLLAQSDILHLHLFRNLLNDLLARTASKQRVPYVLTGHGSIVPMERFIWIKKIYDILLGKWQLQNAAAYIASSPAEKRSMRRFGLPAEKIFVIPEGIGEGVVAEPGSFRKRWGIGMQEKLLVYIGKIARRKGVQHLLRAMKNLPETVRLVIAGNDRGFANHLRRLIHRYDLHQSVLMLPILDEEQKFAALGDADLLVYPSCKDSFSLIPLEAILCGTPVILCRDNPAWRMIQESGAATLVSWGDSEGLSRAIQEQLKRKKDPFHWNGIQEQIRAELDWHRIAQKVLQLYESACYKK